MEDCPVFDGILEHIKDTLEQEKFIKAKVLEEFNSCCFITKNFITDFFEVTNNESDKILLFDLYNLYKEWCNNRKLKANTKIAFSKKLQELGLKKIKSKTNNIFFHGIAKLSVTVP